MMALTEVEQDDWSMEFDAEHVHFGQDRLGEKYLSHQQYLQGKGTARPAVLSQSTGRPYHPRMDNIRPRTTSFSPSSRSSITRTPYRPQRPKKIIKSI
ncbi:hypothetical protein Tco_0288167 [Tanacetum coccineum]